MASEILGRLPQNKWVGWGRSDPEYPACYSHAWWDPITSNFIAGSDLHPSTTTIPTLEFPNLPEAPEPGMNRPYVWFPWLRVRIRTSVFLVNMQTLRLLNHDHVLSDISYLHNDANLPKCVKCNSLFNAFPFWRCKGLQKWKHTKWDNSGRPFTFS